MGRGGLKGKVGRRREVRIESATRGAVYKIVQFLFRGLRTLPEVEDSDELPAAEFEPTKARAAASNTAFKPCCVSAEHSLNDVALMSLHN